MAIGVLESIKIIRDTVKVLIIIKQGISMKVNTKTVTSMVKVLFITIMVISTLVSLLIVCKKVMEKRKPLMEIHTKVTI
jgi:hypothetical protein